MKSALCTIGFDIKYLVANPCICKRSVFFSCMVMSHICMFQFLWFLNGLLYPFLPLIVTTVIEDSSIELSFFFFFTKNELQVIAVERGYGTRARAKQNLSSVHFELTLFAKHPDSFQFLFLFLFSFSFFLFLYFFSLIYEKKVSETLFLPLK